MAEIAVRRARGDDVEACARLFVAHNGGKVAARAHLLADDLDRDGRSLVVAVTDGEVVGYGRARSWAPGDAAPPHAAPPGSYLVGLVVSPGHRRRGIGTALSVARMDWAFERASEAWYFTNAGNAESLALHSRLGFTEVTRQFWFPGVTFTGGVGVLCRAQDGLPGDRCVDVETATGRSGRTTPARESARRRTTRRCPRPDP